MVERLPHLSQGNNNPKSELLCLPSNIKQHLKLTTTPKTEISLISYHPLSDLSQYSQQKEQDVKPNNLEYITA